MTTNHDTILIVDDTPTNLQVLHETLEEGGFEVLVATNGQQALQRAKLGTPDLILLDVVMPGMDGFEICRRLKSNTSLQDIPVIFMTALNDTHHKLNGFATGGLDYVTKPLDHEEVLARVKTHLTIRKLQQALEAQNQQLQAITEALIRFLQTGCHQEASALLLESALRQTQSQYGFMGIVNGCGDTRSSVVRILTTRGESNHAELKRQFFDPMRQAIAQTGHADYSVAELESRTGPAVSESRAVLAPSETSPASRYLTDGVPCFFTAPIRQDDAVTGLLTVFKQTDGYSDAEQKVIERLTQTAGVIYECERMKQLQVKSEQQRQQAEEAVCYLQEEIRIQHNFDEIVGHSDALRQVLTQAERVAKTDSTVLIYGETGTGKELIARAIHNLSPRKAHPLIKVNCAALPESLVESELFGHEKGAFTGATAQRKGRFQLADGGTLFLDEIGDMPLAAQTKLLRVLQEHEFERVGSCQTLRVDVRVLAATHRDLKILVAEGRFREDLYYRLNVFPIELPPLRQRREDIAPLVQFFINRFTTKLGIRIDRIADATLERLRAYAWPGNIRELENIIERAVILSSSHVLEVPLAILPMESHEEQPTAEPARLENQGSTLTTYTNTQDTPAVWSGTLEDVQRQYIIRVLSETGWVIEGKQGAAAILGLNPSTLRNRMHKLGIRKPSQLH